MVSKKAAIAFFNRNGDSIVEFANGEPILCTTDFQNKFIKRVRRSQRFSLKGKVLIFDWTNYKYDAIDVKTIKKITPLSQILKNEPRIETFYG